MKYSEMLQIKIFDLNNKSEFDNYIKRETEIGDYIYKKVTGKNPWTRSKRISGLTITQTIIQNN